MALDYAVQLARQHGRADAVTHTVQHGKQVNQQRNSKVNDLSGHCSMTGEFTLFHNTRAQKAACSTTRRLESPCSTTGGPKISLFYNKKAENHLLVQQEGWKITLCTAEWQTDTAAGRGLRWLGRLHCAAGFPA